ncbi:MAG: septum formation initiator family protein [Prevotellaceae bacterium]|jgi:cell division protein FtsB|nr:septum formation initiator family protein [Prevotellaceae bacterium]
MKVIRIVRNKYFIVGILFVVWIIFLDQSTLIDWGDSLVDLNRQKNEKKFYEDEITRTREKLRLLQSNRDSLEKFAREQYYYLEDGEEIFIVE